MLPYELLFIDLVLLREEVREGFRTPWKAWSSAKGRISPLGTTWPWGENILPMHLG
jgi:hypothetical protein